MSDHDSRRRDERSAAAAQRARTAAEAEDAERNSTTAWRNRPPSPDEPPSDPDHADSESRMTPSGGGSPRTMRVHRPLIDDPSRVRGAPAIVVDEAARPRNLDVESVRVDTEWGSCELFRIIGERAERGTLVAVRDEAHVADPRPLIAALASVRSRAVLFTGAADLVHVELDPGVYAVADVIALDARLRDGRQCTMRPAVSADARRLALAPTFVASDLVDLWPDDASRPRALVLAATSAHRALTNAERSALRALGADAHAPTLVQELVLAAEMGLPACAVAAGIRTPLRPSDLYAALASMRPLHRRFLTAALALDVVSSGSGEIASVEPRSASASSVSEASGVFHAVHPEAVAEAAQLSPTDDQAEADDGFALPETMVQRLGLSGEVERLDEGRMNDVWRAFRTDDSSVVVKRARRKARDLADVEGSPARLRYSARAIYALLPEHRLAPVVQEDVRPAWLLDTFLPDDADADAFLAFEDIGSHLGLAQWLDTGPSPGVARETGRRVGGFVGRLHGMSFAQSGLARAFGNEFAGAIRRRALFDRVHGWLTELGPLDGVTAAEPTDPALALLWPPGWPARETPDGPVPLAGALDTVRERVEAAGAAIAEPGSCLVMGDLGLHSLLVPRPYRRSALGPPVRVVDWEFTRWGHPLDDLCRLRAHVWTASSRPRFADAARSFAAFMRGFDDGYGDQIAPLDLPTLAGHGAGTLSPGPLLAAELIGHVLGDRAAKGRYADVASDSTEILHVIRLAATLAMS